MRPGNMSLKTKVARLEKIVKPRTGHCLYFIHIRSYDDRRTLLPEDTEEWLIYPEAYRKGVEETGHVVLSEQKEIWAREKAGLI